MEEYNIDPVFWYSERKVNFTPKHFVFSNTPVTKESLSWVVNTLKGRFSLEAKVQDLDISISSLSILNNYTFEHIAFEDPKEAVLFELTWS